MYSGKEVFGSDKIAVPNERRNVFSAAARPVSRRKMLGLLGKSALLAAAASGLSGAGCLPDDRNKLTVFYVWRDWQEHLLLEMLELFREGHPEIQLTPVAANMSTLLGELTESARTRTLPDVFVINSGWMDALGGAASLADAFPLAAAEHIHLKELLLPRDYERGILGPAMLSLPAVTSCGTAMFYSRPSLLARAGLPPALRLNNWREFVETSALVVEKLNPGADLRVIGLDPFFGPGMQPFLALAFGAGAPTVTPDRKRSLIDTPAVLAVARAMDAYVEQTLAKFGGYRGLLRWRQVQAGMLDRASNLALANGAQVFCIGGVFVLGETLHMNPAVDLAVQPIPGLNRLHGGTNGHAWSYAMNKFSPNPRAAWKLWKFLTIAEEGNGLLCARLRRTCPIARVNAWEEFTRLGAIWRGVQEATALDVPFATTTDQEFLRPMLFEVPLRRIAGESTDDIFRSIHKKYQGYLDSTQLPG